MNFDNILGKAKDVFQKAYKKADNAIAVQKQRIDAVSLENKLSKDYEALGRLCYQEMVQNGAFNDKEELLKVAEQIKAKKAQAEEIKKEVHKNKMKKRCPKCNSAVEKNAKFCAECGEKFSDE